MNDNATISFKAFLPVLLVFIFVSSFAVVLNRQLASWQVDQPLLLYGNLLLFGVTLSSWFFHRSAITAGNTQAFLRNVYSAMLLKLFVCIIAFFIYVSLHGSNVNKPALFAVMFLYLLYTFTELVILIKYSKKRNSNG
ncbi:MAG: hypothetical protein H7Y03_03720 [Chitinophagaceae bacterium]|nr:hypothetical protein [Chitinophagaceae bacterium]